MSALTTLSPEFFTGHGADSPQSSLSPAEKWRAAGAAEITATGAVPNGDVIGRMDSVAQRLRRTSRAIGAQVDVNGGALLSERARLTGMSAPPPAGETLRGAGLLLRHPEGWAAYNIARPADEEALGALTGGRVLIPERSELERWASDTPRGDALRDAELLDIPSAAVPGHNDSWTEPPFHLSDLAPRACRALHEIRVADYSSLWAGPLAAALLAQAGAQVRRYEAHDRREVPAPGDEPFARRLNGEKELVVFDSRDRAQIRDSLAEADVVLVSARPRALSALGLIPAPGQVFVRITARGVTGTDADRVGFGDDCAAAAGAVGWAEGGPVFAADALADPATGLLAATAAMGLLHAGMSGTVDLNLRGTARWLTANGRGR
ncbi:CoA transferase [Microbacterium sp. A588]